MAGGALVFVVLEVAEVPHQHNDARTGLVVLAVIAGITHLIAAGLADIEFATPRSAVA